MCGSSRHLEMASFPVVWCGCGSVETKLCCTPFFCRLCTRIDSDCSTSLQRPATRCLTWWSFQFLTQCSSEHTGEKKNHINAFHWRHCPKNCTVETLWLSGLYPQSKEHLLNMTCTDMLLWRLPVNPHNHTVKAACDTFNKHTLHHITSQYS